MKKSRIVLVALAVLMVFVMVSCDEPHVHEFGDWEETRSATCTEAGEESRACECGEKETREIAAYGHWYRGRQYKNGKVVQLCYYCGDEKVDSVTVETEEALRKAIAEEVANIYLSNDIVVSDTLIFKGDKKIALNLNGKTLSNSKDIWNEINGGKYSLISVRGSSELIINGNGCLKAKENDVYAVDIRDARAKLAIEDGAFIGNACSVYVDEGSLVVNGGKFSIQQRSNDTDYPYGFILNCTDGSYKNEKAKIVVNGGTFANFNPADCVAEGEHTNFLADGYRTTSNEVDGITWWTVEKN